MKKEEKYLPIGTVVMLKGGTKRLMITGFYTVESGKANEAWDYSGCLYPEGLLASNQICLFDHSQIKEIYHKGLVDEEEKEFKKDLKKMIEGIEKQETQKTKAEKPKTEKTRKQKKDKE